MRILVIVADGTPGGGTTHVQQILHGFSKTYSLGLITQANSPLLKEARSSGIDSFGVNFFRSRLDALVPVKLGQIARKFGAQLVHVHGGRAAFFYALAKTGIPTVYTVHGYHFPHKTPVLVRQLALKAERLASQRVERLIFVSEYDAKIAQAYNLLTNLQRSTVIYNGVQVAKVPRAKPSGRPRLGFIGRLEYQKNPLLFLEVVERLPNYTAAIVGGGTLQDEVKTEIRRRGLASRIHMLGALPHQEALKELTRFHTVVMTSRWEGLPHAPLEAMCAGVPVVATNVGGLSEIIESEASGLLVNSHSADDLAAAIEWVTEDVALRERIIKSARARVYTLFSEERMLAEIRDVYEQMLTQ